MSSLGKSTYSYSGSDCHAFAWFPTDRNTTFKSNMQKIQRAIKSKEQEFKIIELEEKKANEVISIAIQRKQPISVDIVDIIGGEGTHSAIKDKITPKQMEENPDAVRKVFQNRMQRFTDSKRKIINQISELTEALNYYATAQVTPLDSLQTISISVHEPKGMVRRLGHTGICGFTRSVRMIAGTMIFTVINSHPLEMLMFADPHRNPQGGDPDFPYTQDSENGWGTMSSNFLGTAISSSTTVTGQAYMRPGGRISPFNLSLNYTSEYGSDNFMAGRGSSVDRMGAGLMLKGVEFVGEGMVTSIHDMVTEITYNFVARDMTQFTEFDSPGSSFTKKRQRELMTKVDEILSNEEESKLDGFLEAQRKAIEEEEAKKAAEADKAAEKLNDKANTKLSPAPVPFDSSSSSAPMGASKLGPRKF